MSKRLNDEAIAHLRAFSYDNPPDEGLTAAVEFLHRKADEGELSQYTEVDWMDAADTFGLDDEDLMSYLEDVASWL